MKLLLRLSVALVASGFAWILIPLHRAEGEANPAPTSQPETSYNRDVRPILSNRCFKCHGPDLKKGGLNLRERDSAIKEAIVPGKSGESLLVERITAKDADERMPPKGQPLTPEQVATLKAWIDQGAKYEEHWAYVKPVHPLLPQVKNPTWIRNGIDAFILQRLEKEGLTPAPEADKATLIRRVSFDLTGLPPTIQEVDDFLKDQSPDAYEKVVDRLLQSPHYGEHQGRPWLDMARYADTNGYEKDDRRTIWPYRDWVINAFNKDMPFDQFTIEQIAGDLLPNATLEQKIATGFHRNTMVNTEGGTDEEEFRTAAIVDRVNTTGEVWLGSTLACAQCHNHKFDPFSQADYYRLFAFYNNTADHGRDNTPEMPVPTKEQAAQKAKLAEQIAKQQAILDTPTPQLIESQGKWEQQQAGARATWTVLEPTSSQSAGGATLTKQPDKSILAGGKSLDTDTYTIGLSTDLKAITAIRLEALPDKSLPGNGPGRADNGNFVLGEFRVLAALKGTPDKTQKIELQNATSDYAQTGQGEFPAKDALDGNPKTGWAIAPQMGQPHVAVFETKQDLGFDDGTLLTVTLEHNYGGKHILGKFRLSVTTAPRPVHATALPDNIVSLLAIDSTKRTTAQKDELAKYYRSIAPELAKTREDWAKLHQQDATIKVPTTLVLQELPKPRKTQIMKRGNFKNLGDEVTPGTPAKLNPMPPGEPANRLGLAHWLVDGNNPLVGRVLMNRIWARYFGRGFVETSEDFGAQGELQTHPELLDWLATELIERKWSLKAMHKLIVTSATYRQSAKASRELHKRDPYNRLYARGPRLRLEAEAVRDNALAISGLLSPKIGGPSVFPYQPEGVWFNPYSGDKWVLSTSGDQYRRGLYTFWRRTAPYAAFMAFDAPSREICTERRPRTNTPLQALATLNDKAFVDCACALARRMMAEVNEGEKTRATHGFRLCVSRPPSETELEHLLKLYQDSLEKYQKDPAAAKALINSGLTPAPKEMNAAELAAWIVIANVLLNLDETITKG
ncbi:MAG: PSD1 and planctomycete cytochrome C domain-containing protein [Gemmataceae bacterium]